MVQFSTVSQAAGLIEDDLEAPTHRNNNSSAWVPVPRSDAGASLFCLSYYPSWFVDGGGGYAMLCSRTAESWSWSTGHRGQCGRYSHFTLDSPLNGC